jgi:hypothetical protein
MALVLSPPGGREALPDRLAALGRTRKRVAVAAGLFTLVATVVGIVAVVGIADAAVHLGPLPRALALVLLLAATGVLWVRGVVRPMRVRTDALSVALDLENTFTSLNDVLATAVEFADPDGEERPRTKPGVSNRLTAQAVRVAERKANRLPLDRVVPSARCWAAAWACLGILTVATPLALWNTARATTVLIRLADPFGSHPWPTKTQITILAPEQFPARMSKGEAFELKFAVRGVITGPATVRLRSGDGAESEEQFPLAINNDPKHPASAVVTARFEPARVAHNFEVRVTANDADTDWRPVAVIPPPRLVPLDGRPSPQFHATPPTYTRLSPSQLPDGAAVIEIPTGTFLRFRAATDVKLSNAVLAFAGDRAAVQNASPLAYLGHLNPLSAVGGQMLADSLGADVPLTISGEGTRLSADFVPHLSGTYALKLTDDTGLTGTRLIEIRLTADPVPAVALNRPLAGSDPSVLAPTASVIVSAAAEDKLYGVRSLFLEYRVGREGALRTLPLARAVNAELKPLAGLIGGPALALAPPLGVADANRVVPVSAFRRDDGSPLREGDLLILRAAADDWDDVAALKGPGRSAAEVEIRIASPEAIEAWLQKELAAIRADLIRVRDQQRDARQKVSDVSPQPKDAVPQADRDRLASAEQTQRQIRGKVGDARDGMRARADLLQATVAANDLPRTNTTDRVRVVAEELGRTADRDLGAIEQNLTEARGLAAQPLKPEQADQFADFLRKTGRHQKGVEDTVTSLIDLLARWGGAGEIRGEARVLKDAIQRQLTANEQLKDRVPEGKVKTTDDERRDLERAAVRAEQSAEQAGQLIARAGRLAAEKDAQAAELRGQADEKDKQAADLRRQAAEQANPVEKSALNSKAASATSQAAELRAAADKAATEAAALRKGVEAAGGQALPDALREAADRLRQNRQAAAAGLQQDATKRLTALADALAENEPDAVPELAKPKALKGIADALDELAAQQDELRKKVEAASRVADPMERQKRLKELAAEQEQLIQRGRDVLQKLTRDKPDAARDARAALDKMEAARDDLEKGNPAGAGQQADAVDKLDTARDKLDEAAAKAGRQLSDEKRRKLADQVKALVERQKAAVAEAMRVHGDVTKQKGWNKELLTSYSDLDEVREKEIAVEVRKLAEGDFAPLPVLARLLTDSANAMDAARAKIKTRCDDADLAAAFDAELEAANDRKVMRPMTLALRRLEQLADALKPDDKKPQPKKDSAPQPKAPQNPDGGGEGDVIPPLAQLKVLRSLQAELNERTAQFAKDHPDPDKLTDDEKAELKELEQAQREITELFEKMSALFDKKDAPVPPKGDKGDDAKDPKAKPAPEKQP